MLMGRASIQIIRVLGQILMSWRAMGKGTEPMKTDDKLVQWFNFRDQKGQRCYQQAEAKMTEEEEGQTSLEGGLARCTHTHIQMPRSWREADPVKNRTALMGERADNFIPVHPLVRSRTVGNPMVC